MTRPVLHKTVAEVFGDYQKRHTALLRALTEDCDEVYRLCDPDKENLCLFGQSDGSWEVKPPCEEVPQELPEPFLGINFARSDLDRKQWFLLVGVYSDAWLMSVAFFNATRLSKEEKLQLFKQINDLPTMYETLRGTVRRNPKKGNSRRRENSETKTTGKQSKPTNTKRPRSQSDGNSGKPSASKNSSSVIEKEERYVCGLCKHVYDDKDQDEATFWIGCDNCYKWYHGRCVNETEKTAELHDRYICPLCKKKEKTKSSS